MSIFTLSLTAAGYLFFTHDEYTSIDERLQKRTPGVNDPKLSSTMVCMILYVFVNGPRILANALVWSITPILATVMTFIEFLISLVISNYYALSLKKNAVFPSGLVTAIVNYTCVCGPLRMIGKINLFSTLLIIGKVLLLYPIVLFLNPLTVDLDTKPDRFRCWNIQEVMSQNDTNTWRIMSSFNNTFIENMTCDAVQNMNYSVTLYNATLPRFCTCDETSTQFLFNIIIPSIVGMLVAFSISFGYLISNVMKRSNLQAFDEYISRKTEFIKKSITSIAENLCCCKNTKSKVDNERCSSASTALNTHSPLLGTYDVAGSYDESIEGRRNESMINDAIQDDEIEFEPKPVMSDVQKELKGFSGSIMSFLINVRTMFDELLGDNENSKSKYDVTNLRDTFMITLSIT